MGRKREHEQYETLAARPEVGGKGKEAHERGGGRVAGRERGLCRTLPLQRLKRADVATYVATRFPGTADVDALATLIHRRTEGNALFMVTTVQALTSQGLMVEKAGRWALQVGIDALPVPESVRHVIAQQLERLGGKHGRS